MLAVPWHFRFRRPELQTRRYLRVTLRSGAKRTDPF